MRSLSATALGDIRRQFPILVRKIDGHPLIPLDAAATSHKPESVFEAMERFYGEDNANVKRGMHPLAERATAAYEAARERVRQFVNARRGTEIIFTKNCTEAINLVARSWGEANLQKGDVVLLSLLEHHSNIVPWMQLREKRGIEIAWIGVERDGSLKTEEARRILIEQRVRLLALTCVSNVLGTITPYAELARLAHKHGARCLLDAAQLAAHAPMDVQEIACDFLAFSGHKVYGPTGIGVLYGREELLEEMPPFLGGGSMIREVTRDRFVPTHLPDKFEAGTPPVAEAVGLRAALDWLGGFPWEAIRKHEEDILGYALGMLGAMPFVELIGPRNVKHIMSCIGFTTPPVHPHDLTEYCGRRGVCLRAGHHCAQPLHDFLGFPATSRLSIAIHTTREDIDRACAVIEEAYRFFTGK